MPTVPAGLFSPWLRFDVETSLRPGPCSGCPGPRAGCWELPGRLGLGAGVRVPAAPQDNGSIGTGLGDKGTAFRIDFICTHVTFA